MAQDPTQTEIDPFLSFFWLPTPPPAHEVPSPPALEIPPRHIFTIPMGIDVFFDGPSRLPPPHEIPPPSAQVISCVCSDGEVVEVPVNYLRVSRLFDKEYSNGAASDGKWRVGSIRGEVMRQVADWCKQHCGLPEDQIFTGWYDFLFDRLSVKDLRPLLAAAKHLDVPSLVEHTRERVAFEIRFWGREWFEAQYYAADELDEAEAVGDGEEKECRICLCGDEVCAELGRMLVPCNCKGSLKWVHEECIRRWLQTNTSTRRSGRCPQCGVMPRRACGLK